MPTRESSPPPASAHRTSSRLQKDPAGKLRRKQSSNNFKSPPLDAPKRTLSPISSNAMNRGTTTESSSRVLTSNDIGTIRSVQSGEYRLDPLPSKNGGNMPMSRNHSPIPSSHAPPSSLAIRQPNHPSVVRSISTEFGPTRSYNNNSFPIAEDASPSQPQAGQQWSSAVGRANLGKSGRVIERLMGENDMLKRDVHIERLRAEESKQELKMAEAKMDQQMNEYEAKLHDAAINKTLLKRRERQLADLKAQVDGEKLRANKAVEAERGWREACERERTESTAKVEEATTYAALLEGRNKALTSHWTEQGIEVQRAVGSIQKEISGIVKERKEDDSRMNMLQGLCDQQAEQLEGLRRENEVIHKAFEKYKMAQETLLRDIKEKARSQERENEAKLEETKKVLAKLKWALGVQKTVKGAAE